MQLDISKDRLQQYSFAATQGRRSLEGSIDGNMTDDKNGQVPPLLALRWFWYTHAINILIRQAAVTAPATRNAYISSVDRGV